MPSWSSKHQRLYEHVKEASKKGGTTKASAKGKGKSQGEKSPPAKASTYQKLACCTKEKLYSMARQRNIPGRSQMTKIDLIEALQKKPGK